MKLERAHFGAFKEDIAHLCTNRLWVKVGETFSALPPLPTFGIWTTGKARNWWRDKSLWEIITFTPRKTSTMLSIAKQWEFSFYNGSIIGRKERKLVVVFRISWELTDSDKNYFYPSFDEEHTSDGYRKTNGGPKIHTFVTNVEIFPLTPQQAAFVGAKNFSSGSGHTYWGTKEDVIELQEKFPISGAQII